MKQILFFISVLACTSGWAQSKPSLGGYLSSGISHRFTSANSDLLWLNQEMNSKESAAFSYSLGVNMQKALGQKYTLRVGLGFVSMNQNVDSLQDLGIDKYKMNYSFIELPFILERSLGSNKNARPFCAVGYSLNYFMNSNLKYSMVGSNRIEQVRLNEDLSALNHVFRASFGYDFALDKKWNLKAELFCSQFVSSIVKEGISRYPYSFGVQLNLRKQRN